MTELRDILRDKVEHYVDVLRQYNLYANGDIPDELLEETLEERAEIVLKSFWIDINREEHLSLYEIVNFIDGIFKVLEADYTEKLSFILSLEDSSDIEILESVVNEYADILVPNIQGIVNQDTSDLEKLINLFKSTDGLHDLDNTFNKSPVELQILDSVLKTNDTELIVFIHDLLNDPDRELNNLSVEQAVLANMLGHTVDLDIYEPDTVSSAISYLSPSTT